MTLYSGISNGQSHGNTTTHISARATNTNTHGTIGTAAVFTALNVDEKIGLLGQTVPFELQGGIQNSNEAPFVQLAQARIQIRKIIVGGIARKVRSPIVIVIDPNGDTRGQ